jgi:hypothetical protein
MSMMGNIRKAAKKEKDSSRRHQLEELKEDFIYKINSLKFLNSIRTVS